MSSEIHSPNYVTGTNYYTEYVARIIITKKHFLDILIGVALGVVAIVLLFITGTILYEICKTRQDKNSFRRRIMKRNLDIFQLQRTSRNSAISTLKQKMPIITKSNEKEVLNNCVHPGYKTSFFILLIFGIGMTILSCFLKLALIKGL